MRRLTLVLAVFALALAALATPALAGGWAVTTFDDMPGQLVSGKEYALGYTIRQHGETPISVAKTEILAVAVSGRTLSLRASRKAPWATTSQRSSSPPAEPTPGR